MAEANTNGASRKSRQLGDTLGNHGKSLITDYHSRNAELDEKHLSIKLDTYFKSPWVIIFIVAFSQKVGTVSYFIMYIHAGIPLLHHDSPTSTVSEKCLSEGLDRCHIWQISMCALPVLDSSSIGSTLAPDFYWIMTTDGSLADYPPTVVVAQGTRKVWSTSVYCCSMRIRSFLLLYHLDDFTNTSSHMLSATVTVA